MRISESCVKCLYDRQKEKTDNAEYLAEVRALLENRRESDTSPYMVYLFNQVHERYFGKGADYKEIKKQYNDLVLSMEDRLRDEIEHAEDPLAKSMVMARIGNYIDFGAMNHVDPEELLSLFQDTQMREDDRKTYELFLADCAKAKTFLLVCDNCGEVVLDRMMVEQLKKRFPDLKIQAMVRGKEVLNDATIEDAEYCELDREAEILTNGEAVAGLIYDMLPETSRQAVDEADIILAKGQGNYETMSGIKRKVYYEFLCKCDLFVTRFAVPRLTGMFITENYSE